MLTSVLSKVSDPEPPRTEVATGSAAVPVGTAVGVSELEFLEAVTGTQQRLDTSEESHEGEADPPSWSAKRLLYSFCSCWFGRFSV